jgi:hypothetical protein
LAGVTASGVHEAVRGERHRPQQLDFQSVSLWKISANGVRKEALSQGCLPVRNDCVNVVVPSLTEGVTQACDLASRTSHLFNTSLGQVKPTPDRFCKLLGKTWIPSRAKVL